MIFGKSYLLKHTERQAILKYLAHNRVKKFAWWPVQLDNGQYVWLQYVYRRYCAYWSESRREYTIDLAVYNYHLTEK